MQASYSKQSPKIHETVLLKEVTEYLFPGKGQKFIDATLGTAGHSLELVKAGAFVLGIDLDAEMIKFAEARLTEICPKKDCFKLVQGNFRKINEIAQEAGLSEINGILFDLGISNIHLKNNQKGFSFENPEAELDMRLDPKTQGVKAADLLNFLREDQLRQLFETTMEPGAAVWLSRRIVAERELRQIKTVADFLGIVRGLRSKPGLNAATLPMLGLRMAVNSELENLDEALPKAFSLLGKGGKLVVISFHSGEDRIVKEFFKSHGAKDIVVPSEEEVERNPRARSAKLRVLQRT